MTEADLRKLFAERAKRRLDVRGGHDKDKPGHCQTRGHGYAARDVGQLAIAPIYSHFHTYRFHKDHKDPDHKDPERKDPERKDPERKDPERKDSERKDPERKDPESKDPERKDPEPKDPEPKDPGPKDPEPKDPERKDPGPKDPEPKDPEPKDPERKDSERKDPERKDPEPKDPEPKDPEPKDPPLGPIFDGSFGIDAEDLANAPGIDYTTLQYFPDQTTFGPNGEIDLNDPHDIAQNGVDWVKLHAKTGKT